MHLSSLRLRDFRNYARLDAQFVPGFHLLLGNNAQGKTNVLEAIYLLATLRSFRGVASAQMVRHEQKGYFVGGKVQHLGEHEIKMYWSARERALNLDGRTIKKLTEYLGIVRAVVFCSEDIQLIKGPSSKRRRFIDLLLAQTVPAYLPLLQRYARAVRSRNALLRQRMPDPSSLEAFTREMITLGQELMNHRRKLLPVFNPVALAAHQKITLGQEELRIDYAPSVRSDFAGELRASEQRDRAMRSSLVGPHRDELEFKVNGQSASKFCSEGQKRSIAIALKLAQAEFLANFFGSPPILLIDDVMGELDARRRAAFVPLLKRVQQARSQVFMTCTEENWPADLGIELQRWEVKGGRLSASKSS